MKICRLIITIGVVLATLMGLLTLGSCIKGEPKNAEADILTCTIEGVTLKAEPALTNDAIMVLVFADKNGKNLRELAPEFTLTPGATIKPESGTVLDFTADATGGTNTHIYTVYSENGRWEKSYKVTITDRDYPTDFFFNHWYKTGSYEQPYQPVYNQPDGTGNDPHIELKIWSSGNAGYAVIGGSNPSDFPTCSTTETMPGSGSNYSARLETKLTGYKPLPLAAGNLFMGSFDGSIATTDPMRATRFGVPFNKKPLKLSGNYKYKSGEIYKERRKDDKGNWQLYDVPEKKDSSNIYAVLYYKDMPGSTDEDANNGENRLHGANVKTSDRVIAFAALGTKETDGKFIHFEIDFDYDGPEGQDYIDFDPELRDQYKYYLAIVCAASSDGAEFSGSPGSLLIVNDLKVTVEEE